MIRVNVAPVARRSRRLTIASDFARSARLTALAVEDAIALVETAADIAVEVEVHRRLATLPC